MGFRGDCSNLVRSNTGIGQLPLPIRLAILDAGDLFGRGKISVRPFPPSYIAQIAAQAKDSMRT